MIRIRMLRMPLKNGYTLWEGGRNGYEIQLWTQPYHRWIISRIYHRWDMTAPRLPGFKALERWLLRHASTSLADEDFEIPLGCKQDLKCWHLAKRGRVWTKPMPIAKEDYDRLSPGGL